MIKSPVNPAHEKQDEEDEGGHILGLVRAEGLPPQSAHKRRGNWAIFREETYGTTKREGLQGDEGASFKTVFLFKNAMSVYMYSNL